jgi:hypothetical protein
MARVEDLFFKTDPAGRRVYFPFGTWGRGRVLPDQQTEQRLRRISNIGPTFIIVASVLATSFISLWVGLGLGLVGILAFEAYFLVQVRGLPVSEMRLTFPDTSREMRRASIMLLIVGAVFTVVCMVYLVLIPGTGWFGFGMTAFSLVLLGSGVYGLVASGRG